MRKYYLKNKDKILERNALYPKEKKAISSSKTYRKNSTPEKRKNHKLKHRYGISLEDYKVMHLKQKGLCKICNSESKLHVDHDHKTGRIRGLLCFKCNNALGNINDDIKILEKMINYLK